MRCTLTACGALTANAAAAAKSAEVVADDSDEDVPLSKKAKAGPTDDDLRAAVKAVLTGANLDEMTVKKVRELVGAKFPGADLAERKDVIKAAVEATLSA